MSRFPEDDPNLVRFLRRNRPNPPPPDPNLENQLMRSLSDLPRSSVRRLWLVPCAVAAGLIGAIVGSQLLKPPTLNLAEAATIETYLESNWSTTVNGVSDTTSDATPEYVAWVEFTNESSGK